MNEQVIQNNPEVNNTHSHKVLYASLGLLLGSVVMLLVVVGIYYSNNKNTNSASQQNEEQAQAIDSQEQMFMAAEDDTASGIPIETKQDLDRELSTLDSNDTADITAGLDQNTADASQFSQ